MGSTFASFNFVSKKHKALNILKINLAYKYFVVDHGQIDSNLPLSEYVANLRQYTINRSDIVGRPRKFFFHSPVLIRYWNHIIETAMIIFARHLGSENGPLI